MKIIIYNGLDEGVYKYIAPFAMDIQYIKQNGNPITTSKFHKWYVGINDNNDVLCFCSVKFYTSVKKIRIGNLFNIQNIKIEKLIKKVIKDYTKDKALELYAYSNTDNLKIYNKLGFIIEREGKNWHELKYKK